MHIQNPKDTKELISYTVGETRSSFFGGFLFESYEWVSRLSGTYAELRTFAPYEPPQLQFSKYADSTWFTKVGVNIDNRVTYATF